MQTQIKTYHKTELKTAILEFLGAAKDGDIEAVQRLLHKGVPVDSRNSKGWTALQLSAKNGHCAIVETLLASGANVNTKDIDYSLTPLHGATLFGKLDVVKVLLQNGSLVDAKDINGATALHFAACYEEFKIAKELLRNGAPVNAVTKDGWTPLHSICYSASPVYNSVQMVELLLQNGADRNARTNKNETPLDFATTFEIKHLLQTFEPLPEHKEPEVQ